MRIPGSSGHEVGRQGQGARIRAFNFIPQEVASEFKEKGYAHVVHGVSDEFFRFAQEQLAMGRLTGESELQERKIKNKKRQYLFELPKDDEFLADLRSTIATIIGANPAQVTLSERHIKVYDENAPPFPRLHKDCVASQVAVGIPLEQNAQARIVLVPHAMRNVNPLDVAVYGARPGANPDGCMRTKAQDGLCGSPGEDPEAVMLDVRPGDVVIFPGSSMYHERLNAAGSAVLYLKLNAMRLDFLGEDAGTQSQRNRSLVFLGQKSDVDLLLGTVEVSPRLQHISRHYTRLSWTTVLHAYVAGSPELAITEGDLRFLLGLCKPTTVREALLCAGVSKGELLAQAASVRKLAECGVIDFLD